jgi:membrane protease YdiL (CAAX protease family)
VIDGTPPRPDLGSSAPLPPAVPAVGVPGRIGLKGHPPVGWSGWQALMMFLLGNLLIGQVVVATVILLAMGVDQVSSGAAGTPELAATLGADVATVIFLLLWLPRKFPGWLEALGWPAKGERLREVVVGVFAGPAVYVGVAVVATVIIGIVLSAASGQDAVTPDQIDAASLSRAGQILTVIVAVIVAPITEEFLFRGIVFRAIRDRRGFWVGAIVSSLVFGLVHFVPAPWQDTVLLQAVMVCTGLALASIYEWRGNLLTPIVTHMAFNAVGVTLILAFR